MIKVTKFGEDWLNGFGAMEEKPGNEPFCPSPPGLTGAIGTVLQSSLHGFC